MKLQETFFNPKLAFYFIERAPSEITANLPGHTVNIYRYKAKGANATTSVISTTYLEIPQPLSGNPLAPIGNPIGAKGLPIGAKGFPNRG